MVRAGSSEGWVSRVTIAVSLARSRGSVFGKEHAAPNRRAQETECIAKPLCFWVLSEVDELQTVRGRWSRWSVKYAKVAVGSLGPGAEETSGTGC